MSRAAQCFIGLAVIAAIVIIKDILDRKGMLKRRKRK